MKNVLLLASGLLAVFYSFAQSDTAVGYYDQFWQPVTSGTQAVYYSKSWAEKGRWHRKDFYLPGNMVQMDAWFADKATTIFDGPFITYKKSGTVETSSYTENNQYFEAGTPFYGVENGMEVFEWRKKNGKISVRKITDNNGNGTQTYYQEDGKTIASEGKLVGYKRDGDWIFKDDKNITGVAVTYKAGEVVSKSCYDESGKPDTQHSNCDVSVAPQFKGGTDGWRIFMEKNLRYPKQARKNGIQGLVSVQFMVQVDGTVTDIKVLRSADFLLEEEALKLLEKSPKWEPARNYNRPVKYQHTQNITFRLE